MKQSRKKGIRFIILLFFLAFLLPLWAQEFPSGFGGSIEILPHKESYIYPFHLSRPKTIGGNDNIEAKFQFSLKLSFLEERHHLLNFAYTQKSFWQVFNDENSRPFRETNYRPEVFSRFGGSRLYFDLGILHESNGEEDPASRGWDKTYVIFHYEASNLKASFKYWVVLNEQKYGADIPERPSSLKRYYGSTQLSLGYRLGEAIIKNTSRYSTSSGKGYFDFKLMYPLSRGVYVSSVYSKGYGQSLRDYARNHETFSFGLLLNP